MGAVESAAAHVITAWRKDGHSVDPLQSSLLRGAAMDVDNAIRDYRAGDAGVFPITRARTLLHELWTAYRPATAQAADPFAQLVEQLRADA